jgi:uncharacterized membrane protein YozB (DUF420 family)
MKTHSERIRRDRKEPVTFSLNKFLLMSLCFVILVGITVVGLMAPALDAFDKWTAQPENQIKIVFVSLFSGIVLTVYMVIQRLRG